MRTIRLKLRRDQVEKHMASAGIRRQKDLADRAGVTEAGIYRTLEGRTAPGGKVIAGLLAAFPHLTFEDLFEVVTDDAA